MKQRIAITIILPAMAIFSVSAYAATLQIDFSTAHSAQAGWETLSGTGTPSGTYSGYTTLASGNITVTGAGIGFDRKAGNNAEPAYDFPGTNLDAMYGDLLFTNNGTANVDFTIGGLLAGTYIITTHNLISTPNPGVYNLRVQDADSPSFGQNVGDFNAGVGNASTFNPSIVSFGVVSNGTDPIIVRMTEVIETTGGNTGGWFGFNGMEIAVPEPSSLLLSGLGVLALLRRRR